MSSVCRSKFKEAFDAIQVLSFGAQALGPLRLDEQWPGLQEIHVSGGPETARALCCDPEDTYVLQMGYIMCSSPLLRLIHDSDKG